MNPYIDDGDDSDILNEEVEDTTTHSTSFAYRDSSIPEELKDTFSSIMPRDFEVNILSKLPAELKAMGGVFSHFADYKTFHQKGPLLQALAEVVDELSNGKVTLLFRFHESERRLMFIDSIRKMSNVLYQATEVSTSNSPILKELALYFEVFNEILAFSRLKTVNEYRNCCESLNIEADEYFLETGVFSSRSEFAKVSLCYPTTLSEH